MTGFGRSTYENEGREYIIEIKSVYYRFTDKYKNAKKLKLFRRKNKKTNFK